MTANDWTIIIAAIGVVAAQITQMVLSYMRDRDNNTKMSAISDDIERVHVATNGMKDALVRVTGESEKAKGNLEGRAELKAETAVPTHARPATGKGPQS